MQRTQIYLTSREAAALDAAARQTGQTRSHLIREAIEAVYLGSTDSDDQLRALAESAGIWADRPETGEMAVERLRPGRVGRLHGVGHAQDPGHAHDVGRSRDPNGTPGSK